MRTHPRLLDPRPEDRHPDALGGMQQMGAEPLMHPALSSIKMFQTSPAPSSAPHISPGEREPSVMPACGAGEPAAVESSPAAAGPIPAGYVLVERELLGRLLKRVQQIQARDREALRERLPSFLTADHLKRA
jgi:hypothetical protein